MFHGLQSQSCNCIHVDRLALITLATKLFCILPWNSETNTRAYDVMWDDSSMFKLREQNFQVKLKIGKIDRFITQSCSAQHRLERKDLMVDNNPSGSTKRITSPGGTQTASCSVDGCSSDLSKCKLYHRRHRVCERHSKAPLVIVRGQKKRFCQQCSRFHPLEEFDEVKRSCRKRLAGHNKRRRKPRPGSFGISESTIRFLQFGAPQIPAATSTAISYQNQLSRGDSNTFSWTYNGKYEWFPFAEPKGHQRSSQVAVATGDSFCPPRLQSILSSENERCGHEYDGNIQSINSNSALYLLSMNSIPTAGTGLSHFMQSEVINPVSPQCSEMQVNSESMFSPILLPGIGESSAGCNGIFHPRPDSLLEHGMRSTLTGL